MKKYNNYQESKLKRLRAFLIHILGEEDGNKRYISLMRSSSKKVLIFKYGKLDGERMYNSLLQKHIRKNTLDGYIERYGDVEGPTKYYEKNKKLSVGYESLKRKGLSEEQIDEIRKNHRDKSKNTLDVYISRYGEDIGLKKYHEHTRNRKSIWDYKYWMEKGMCEAEAKLYVSQLQRRDLNFFIDRYGDSLGKIKYELINRRRSYTNTKLYYIEKYGDELGNIKWNELNKKRSHTLDSYIFKYGNEEGTRKYHETLRNRFTSRVNRSRDSNVQIKFCQDLYNALNDEYKKYVYGMPISNGYFINFELNEFNIKCCVPDIRIKNILIEYDGDYWHSNPEVKTRDLQKTKLLTKMGYKIYRVLDSSYQLNSEYILSDVLKFIYENIDINFTKNKYENNKDY